MSEICKNRNCKSYEHQSENNCLEFENIKNCFLYCEISKKVAYELAENNKELKADCKTLSRQFYQMQDNKNEKELEIEELQRQNTVAVELIESFTQNTNLHINFILKYFKEGIPKDCKPAIIKYLKETK